jgi:protein translocase SecG subunit
MFFIDILQLITGILLIVTILMQSKGDGLGSAFGGGGGGVQTTRRGAEKTLFNITVVLSAVFIGLASSRIFIG